MGVVITHILILKHAYTLYRTTYIHADPVDEKVGEEWDGRIEELKSRMERMERIREKSERDK